MEQWYEYVPAVLNVKVKFLPGPTPALNALLSAVTVWETGSLFVQVTVLLTPMTTVIESGLKA